MIFKIPRLTTAQRLAITPGASEMIFDTDLAVIYYGDGVTVGGILLESGTVDLSPYTTLVVTSAISAGLDSRIDVLEAETHVDSLNGLSGHLTIQAGSNIGVYAINSTTIGISSVAVSGAGITDHNLLNNLQGGTTGEYYHLSAAQFSDYIGRTEVQSISAGLQNEIDGIIPDLSAYTTLVVTSAISAGLDSRIDVLEANPVPDIFRAEVQAISAGLQNEIDGIIIPDLSPYTTLVVTSAISAGLDSRIDVLEAETHVDSLNGLSGHLTIQAGSNIGVYAINSTTIGISSVAVSGAGITDHNLLNNLQGGTTGEYYHLSAAQFSNYIGRTEVQSISAGLDSRIDVLEANPVPDIFRTEVQAISAGLDSRIDILEANPVPDIFRTEVQSISAGLQNEIDGIIIPDLSPYTTLVTTSAISAGLDSRIDVLEANPVPDIFRAEVQAISAGLDSRIDILEANPVPDIFRAEVAAISAGLQSEIDGIIIPDLSPYTTLITTASISAGLDSRIDILEAETHVDSLNGLSGNLTLEAGSNIGVYAVNSTTIGISSSGTGGIISDYDGNSLYNFMADVLEISGSCTLNAVDHMARVINTVGATTFTVPNDLPTGFSVTISQFDPGTVSISAGAGATVHDRLNRTELAGLYAVGTIITVRNPGGNSSVSVLAGDLIE